MTNINPIIPGFAPDPSIAKVGEWYYLVNSTFHIYPGLPVYASQDLTTWKHIGNAINRLGQLNLTKSRTNLVPLENGEVMLATGGLYAPTIRFHEGTFYIACTNLVHVDPPRAENFIISTTDIWAGIWSDPVYVAFDGIDPSLLFDDGKVYVQGSRGPGPKTRIQQFEVDVATGERLSDERTIWRGTGREWAEGPHVYRRDGWYHLVISEGGTHEGHMVTAARSRDVWGPYEACPNNPILTAKGAGEYVQHTGHCDIFEDGEGCWWGVCLGVRKDRDGRYVLGRESFLTRAAWDGGWPTLDRVTLSPEGVRRGEGPALSAAPGVDYVYIRDPELSRYTLAADGTAALTSSPTDLSHPEDSPTFLGKRQRRLEGTSTVTIRHAGGPSWSDAGLRAGIACYKDEHRYLRLYLDAAASRVVFESVNAAKGISKTGGVDVEVEDGSAVTFRLEYTEGEYKLWYRLGGVGEFMCLWGVDALDLTGPDFVGPVIGAFAVSGGEECVVECSELSVE